MNYGDKTDLKRIDLEESKKIQLDILKYFHSFCQENEITYFIAYGTLLGAIRHKGFIPWDDDIDTVVPEKDYYKLIKLFNEKCKDSNYYLVSPFDKYSKHPYIKIIDKRTIKVEYGLDYKDFQFGIDIDVFLLDGRPDNEKDNEIYCKKIKKYIGKYSMALGTFKGISRRDKIKRIIFGFPYLPKKYCFKKGTSVIESYPYESSSFVGATQNGGIGVQDWIPKECYAQQIDMEFEGCLFKAPVGYDEIMHRVYGDYLQLPPVEKRVTHHAYRCYWKEDCNK